MNAFKIISLSIFIFSLVSCCPYKEKLDKTKEISSEAVKLFGPPMAKNVMEKVEKSGFENAVEFCSGFAPGYEVSKNKEILSLFTEKYNIKNINIKRTSLKFRNPNNAPDNVEKEIMTSWQKDEKNGVKAEPATKYKNGVYYSLIPIRIASPVCLGCHGEESQRDKKAYKKILTKFPDDKAIGYQRNGLRGAFSVTIEF